MNSFAKLMRIMGLLMVVGAISYLWWMNQAKNPAPTQLPTEQNQYRLVSAQFLNENCDIQIKTTTTPITLETGFEPGISKCEQFSIVLPSPSGQIVAFEDLSGGIDSWLKIYSAKHQETIGVEVLGTSSILGMAFLPDDRLAVLHGYGLTDEQWLRVYNLPKLIAEYPENAGKTKSAVSTGKNSTGAEIIKEINNFSEEAVGQATSILDLPAVGENYQYVQLDGNKLKLFGRDGVKSKALAEFKVDSI